MAKHKSNPVEWQKIGNKRYMPHNFIYQIFENGKAIYNDTKQTSAVLGDEKNGKDGIL